MVRIELERFFGLPIIPTPKRNSKRHCEMWTNPFLLGRLFGAQVSECAATSRAFDERHARFLCWVSRPAGNQRQAGVCGHTNPTRKRGDRRCHGSPRPASLACARVGMARLRSPGIEAIGEPGVSRGRPARRHHAHPAACHEFSYSMTRKTASWSPDSAGSHTICRREFRLPMPVLASYRAVVLTWNAR